MCSLHQRADRAHARFSSAKAELLSSIAELDANDSWHGDGASDLASWLAARWQISLRTARELVRDAQALTRRPALHTALASGSISVDQCKALSVLTREETDDDASWLETLNFWSYQELEREARKQKARELERKDGGTYLRTHHTTDERFLRGEFQLHPEEGAILIAALDARVPTGTPLRDWDAAQATALIDLARGGSTPSSQRPTLLVTVTDDVPAGADDAVALSTGGFVGAETVRRLSCDARMQELQRDRKGNISGIGPMKAAIPVSTRRAVEIRDGRRCTFPGCGRSAFLECHHIVHRAHGGSNELANLQLVCWTHHTLIHEGGWSLAGDAGPSAVWIRPDGTPFEPRVRVTLDTS